jgi:ESCRT-II complex subunit VPS36
MSTTTSSSWSPFDCLPVAPQTQSGLLQKDSGEVEVSHRGSMVELRATNRPMVPMNERGTAESTRGRVWVDRCLDLTLQLTTHRIVLWRNNQQQQQQSSNTRQARFVHLSNVSHVTTEKNGLFASPKIHLQTFVGESLWLVFSNTAIRDDACAQLQKCVDRQEWTAAEKLLAKQQRTKNLTAHKVGIDKVLAKNKIRHEQAAQATEQALQGDAEDLLQQAAELVAIVHGYMATLEKQSNTATTDSKSTTSESESAQLAAMLHDMGMTFALRKSDYKGQLSTYYVQLARQLADVLRPKLARVGGVMTLTDAYCFFNRARATDLLSPEDLLLAVDCLERLSVGISKRVFPSGLIVLQEDATSDSIQVATKLQELALTSNGVNELEAAKAMNTSALLAHEQLLAAEQVGFLVRDESLETLRFFPNQFEVFYEQWIKTK